MEKLLGDTSEFIKVAFNPKLKVNNEVRHLRDVESNIKLCLDDLLKNNYLSKKDYNFMKPFWQQIGIFLRIMQGSQKT